VSTEQTVGSWLSDAGTGSSFDLGCACLTSLLWPAAFCCPPLAGCMDSALGQRGFVQKAVGLLSSVTGGSDVAELSNTNFSGKMFLFWFLCHHHEIQF